MSQHYTGHGIGFEFPDSWAVSEDEQSGQISISVQSEGTSFWSVYMYKESHQPSTLIETAIDAFREEYEDLELSEIEVEICQQPTLAWDLDFVCLDMINRAYLRAFHFGGSSILILYQGADFELNVTLPDLELICESLVFPEEE